MPKCDTSDIHAATHYEFARSLTFVGIVGAVLLFVTALVWVFLPWLLALLATLFLVAYAWGQWRVHVARDVPSAIVGLTLDARGHYFTNGRGVRVNIDTLEHAVVYSWLALVPLQDTRARRHMLVVLPDMLPAEQFRALRVALSTTLAGTG
jgi:hypothetical protein